MTNILALIGRCVQQGGDKSRLPGLETSTGMAPPSLYWSGDQYREGGAIPVPIWAPAGGWTGGFIFITFYAAHLQTII